MQPKCKCNNQDLLLSGSVLSNFLKNYILLGGKLLASDWTISNLISLSKYLGTSDASHS